MSARDDKIRRAVAELDAHVAEVEVVVEVWSVGRAVSPDPVGCWRL